MRNFQIILSLLATTLLTSCYSEKQASRQLVKAQTNYSGVVAKYCSQLYPVKERNRDSIVYLVGKDEVFLSRPIDRNEIVASTIKIPHSSKEYIYRVDTVMVFKDKVIEDVAKIEALEAKNKELIKSIAGSEKVSSILLKVAIVLGVYTLLRWLLRVWYIRLP